MKNYTIELLGEAAMIEFGTLLGCASQRYGAVIFLSGNLGMGKTTLSCGVLRAFGHQGAVKSPTYTLVEPYEFNGTKGVNTVYHFDLYRLGDPEELEYMGIRDYFNDSSLCLVEWPERGGSFLPKPDLDVDIRLVNNGRVIELKALTEMGQHILSHLT